jgi:DNA polymerase/3'-5' exonuclease PolX
MVITITENQFSHKLHISQSTGGIGMSSGERIPRSAATTSINLVRGMLNRGIERFEVCGSYRVGKPTIGDVDLVILPSDNFTFLDHLDSLVSRDLVKQGRNAGGSTSWGDKKRLISFRGMAFDIAIANEHNFGYQHWLRTGPAKANRLLMSLLIKHNSRVRMDDGYLWHVTYHSNYLSSRERKEAQAKKEVPYHKLERLSVPDEETFFTLLGMPYIEPEKREKDWEIIYNRYLGRSVNTQSPEVLKQYYLSAEQKEALASSGIKQKSLL